MKVYEAAIQVLSEESRPLSPKEVYDGIMSRNLFEFTAKDPVAVVSKALRSRALSNTKNASNSLFGKTDNGLYILIRQEIPRLSRETPKG